ncbi:MAG: LOG family protein [Sedimentisphaerales bacterium]|nr:LOG family protein [Sedimentisphaerales bacterium]
MDKIVTIFGTSKGRSGGPLYELTYHLGLLLAEAGYTIVNGGYGGTMEAAARGAAQAGGQVIGVTCSAFGRSGPNGFITKEILTDSLQQRLDTLIELGQAYLILPGGTGTLLELAQVWEMKNKKLAGQDKPILLLGPFWVPLVGRIGKMDANSRSHIEPLDTPEQIIVRLKETIG